MSSTEIHLHSALKSSLSGKLSVISAFLIFTKVVYLNLIGISQKEYSSISGSWESQLHGTKGLGISAIPMAQRSEIMIKLDVCADSPRRSNTGA